MGLTVHHRIIGKGGCFIKEIQDTSGAHVDIAKTCAPGATERELLLKGSAQQMATCKYLIEAKIAGEDRRGSGFGNQQQSFGGGQQQAYGQQVNHLLSVCLQLWSKHSFSAHVWVSSVFGLRFTHICLRMLAVPDVADLLCVL